MDPTGRTGARHGFLPRDRRAKLNMAATGAATRPRHPQHLPAVPCRARFARPKKGPRRGHALGPAERARCGHEQPTCPTSTVPRRVGFLLSAANCEDHRFRLALRHPASGCRLRRRSRSRATREPHGLRRSLSSTRRSVRPCQADGQ
jgi:hypothetical protein